MTERDTLAERFEENRAQLRAVSYWLLGSLTEADDAVQEAWLTLSGAEAGDIRNLHAGSRPWWGRVSLDPNISG